MERSKLWFEANNVPSSTQLHPLHLEKLISNGGSVLYLGSGTGEKANPLTESGVQVVGVDGNRQLIESASPIDNKLLIEGDVRELPNDWDECYDGVMMLGLLSTMNKLDRLRTLYNAQRVLKQGGLLALSDFAFVRNPFALTSKNHPWPVTYLHQYLHYTREFGSTRFSGQDGSVLVGHHFRKRELVEMLMTNGLYPLDFRRYQVRSTVSGYPRPNFSILAQKVA